MSPERWLLGFAGGVIVGHHTGFLLEPLGSVGGIADGETRWSDWIDLALPYLVVGCSGAALAAAATRGRIWLLFGFAAVLYTQGHGIHLAANSIANVAPAEPAHLWDEVIGHYLWYGGLAGLVSALGLAVGDLPPPELARRSSPHPPLRLHRLHQLDRGRDGATWARDQRCIPCLGDLRP